MKVVFLVIVSKVFDYEQWRDDIYAFDNEDKALEKFEELVATAKAKAERVGWEVELTDEHFSSWESGCYIENHCDIRINATKVN